MGYEGQLRSDSAFPLEPFMKTNKAILDDCCTLLLDDELKGADYEAIVGLVKWFRRGFRQNFHECDRPAWDRVKALHRANWPHEEV